MLKAIIFDLDDTLLKTKQTKFAAQKFAGKHFYNLEITDEKLRQHWGKPFLTFMSEVYDYVDTPENIAKNYRSIVQNYANEAYEDVLPVLAELYDQYKVCVLTAAPKSLVLYDMEHAGIRLEGFSYIQTEEDTTVHKPDPMVFSPMIDRLATHGIQIDEMLYVGDHPTDFKAATGAGLHFIGIAERSIPKSEFEAMGATTIDSLLELRERLEQFS